MSRDLSTKGLSRRLHSEYATLRPFRHKLFGASLMTVVFLAVLWGVASTTGKRDFMYQPGPVSFVHRASAQDCEKCHQTWHSTPDDKCQSCHSSRAHNPQANARLKMKAPGCAECHSEHHSTLRPPPPPDAKCVKCHGDLLQRATNDSRSVTVVEKITSFNHDHPEFGIIKKGGKDPAHLSFNHNFHMTKEVRQKKIGSMNDQWGALVGKFLDDNGIEKDDPPRTELACTDCHVLDQSSRLVEPVKYEQHCASCHPLAYELTSPKGDSTTDKLPHGDPENTHRFLLAKFSEQQEANKPPVGSTQTVAQLKAQNEWVKNKTLNVEQGLLTGGTCKKCHDVEEEAIKPGGPPPTKLFSITPTDITRQWLPHAWFSHSAHREMKCEDCHGGIRSSEKTEDVNLPKIQQCQECHKGSGGARADCAECHLYHNKKDRSRHEGVMRLPGQPGK